MSLTTNTITGNKVLFYVDGDAVGCTTGATLNGTNNQIETTCKDNDGAVTYAAGSQDWNIQVTANTKFDAVVGFQALAALWKTKGTFTARMGTTNSVDDPYFEGDGFISAFTWDGPVNAPSTWSFTVSPRGPLYLYNT